MATASLNIRKRFIIRHFIRFVQCLHLATLDRQASIIRSSRSQTQRLLGAVNSLHRVHMPPIATCEYMYRVNVYKRASVYLSRGSVGCPFAGSLMSRYARTSERAGGRASVLFTCSFTTRPFHVRARYRSPISSSYFISAPASLILDPIARVHKSQKRERGYDRSSWPRSLLASDRYDFTEQYIRIV